MTGSLQPTSIGFKCRQTANPWDKPMPLGVVVLGLHHGRSFEATPLVGPSDVKTHKVEWLLKGFLERSGFFELLGRSLWQTLVQTKLGLLHFREHVSYRLFIILARVSLISYRFLAATFPTLPCSYYHQLQGNFRCFHAVNYTLLEYLIAQPIIFTSDLYDSTSSFGHLATRTCISFVNMSLACC